MMKFLSILVLIVAIIYASSAAVIQSAAQSQAISKAKLNTAAKLSGDKYKVSGHSTAIETAR